MDWCCGFTLRVGFLAYGLACYCLRDLPLGSGVYLLYDFAATLKFVTFFDVCCGLCTCDWF